MKKSELRELIREMLREELSRTNLKEGAYDGGYAEGGFLNVEKSPRPNWSCQPKHDDYLDRMKRKNPVLVDIMTVKGKDLKPGMFTQAGEVKTAEVNSGKKKIYVMHTNNWDCFKDLEADVEVMVDPDDSSKPYVGSFQDLKKRGLKESVRRR